MELTRPRDSVATLLAVLVVSAAVARSDGALCDKSDKAALLAVKSALGNPPALSGWNSTVACCSWEGISCNATTGRVTDLTVLCKLQRCKLQRLHLYIMDTIAVARES